MIKTTRIIVLITVAILYILSDHQIKAQVKEQLVKDLSYHMQIPELKSLSASPLHLYALSESEGLIIFRSYKDSLQWLFTLSDVQERGYKLHSDLRFAYLYSDSSLIHVIEPTSLLGIYSVADVGFPVADLCRVNEFLFVAGKNGEFKQINLIHPDSVVSTLRDVQLPFYSNEKVKAIASNQQNLFYLTHSDSVVYSEFSGEGWIKNNAIKVSENVESIFYDSNRLFFGDINGKVSEYSFKDSTIHDVVSFPEKVISVQVWDSTIVSQTESGLIFITSNSVTSLITSATDAGNHFTVSKHNLWFSEYNDLFRMIKSKGIAQKEEFQTNWKLKPIDPQIIPFPKPLLINVDTEPSSIKNNLLYSIKSSFQTIKQFGNNFVWKPTARDVGKHLFMIIATDNFGKRDSITVSVDVRAFNQPPKFAPFRPISIPVEVPYSITFTAFDPDGSQRNLIRYVGLDMPQGSFVNEKTGEFTWTPTLQQVGEHQFRMIATDQFGVAASLDVKMNVIEVRKENNE